MKNLLAKYNLTNLFRCVPENGLQLTIYTVAATYTEKQKDELEIFGIDISHQLASVLSNEVYTTICKQFIKFVDEKYTHKFYCSIFESNKWKEIEYKLFKDSDNFLIVSNKFINSIVKHNKFKQISNKENYSNPIMELGEIKGHKIYSTYLLEDIKDFVCMNKDDIALYYNDEIKTTTEDYILSKKVVVECKLEFKHNLK